MSPNKKSAPTERPPPVIDKSDGCCLKEEGVSKPEEKEPSSAEQKSEDSLEKPGKAGAVMAELAEDESQTGEESSIALLLDDLTCKTPEEAKDKLPGWGKERDTIHPEKPGASLFYLQVKTEHVLEGELVRVMSNVEGEHAQPKRPPPMIDKLERHHDEERPETKERRSE